MPAPCATADEFAARLGAHVRQTGGLTSAEWVWVLKASAFFPPVHNERRFRSTTFDVRDGRLVVSTTGALVHPEERR